MKRTVKQYSGHLIIAFIAGVTAVGIYSYLTNPFVRFSIIRDPYIVTYSANNTLQLKRNYAPTVVDGFPAHQFAFLKSGWHIISNRISRRPKIASGNSLEKVINHIHELRFDPNVEFLISGDHFSMFYPRSLGIFYHTTLDPRTALNKKDWLNRQAIYAKSTAYALQVYSESDHLSTTIVPISTKAVTLMNIYAPPSDTLYSLLFGLKVLRSPEDIEKRYPFTDNKKSQYRLSTKKIAADLLQEHKKDLQRHWTKYFTDVYDNKTGLIKKDIRLSGTKDMAIRSSSFYDNVILWSTHKLAQELRIIPADKSFLTEYKARILKTFWERKKGYFSEDLGKYNGQYSSDWIIAYQTGFLSPENSNDREYLEKSIAYIQQNKIDRPFGLRYHPDLRKDQLYLPVRLFAPDYGSTAIWSHWGMEYVKLLAHISKLNHNISYAKEARYEIEEYKKNIVKYNGYPELYRTDGTFFTQRFYESVLNTGWVVNFELAAKMTASLTE